MESGARCCGVYFKAWWLGAIRERFVSEAVANSVALVALAEHPSEAGIGVAVTRFWKAGSEDYKRIPELAGVDLDSYRQRGRFETRVTVGK